ncbi:MAG: small metal-binding protein SmbP [Gammaproteobacteria bacterium]
MKLINTKFTGLWIAMALLLCTSFAWAEGNHLAKAIMDTQAATRAATGEGIVEHAEMALTHVKAEMALTEAEATDEHLLAAVTSLDGAIELGKQGNVDLARKSAIEAKAHLKAVQ